MNAIIAINSGSSSCKFSAFVSEGDILTELFTAKTDHQKHQFSCSYADGHQFSLVIAAELNSLQQAFFGLQQVLAELKKQSLSVIAIGHRFAHCGLYFDQSTLVNKEVLAQLHRSAAFASLHMPSMVALLESTLEIAVDIPQIACFDTSFHQSRSEFEKRYAIADSFSDAGLCSYGFHGLSYQSIVKQLQTSNSLTDNLVVLHLGNGASLCAIHKGESVYTTMGFSPLDGLVMGARCGHLDPGALLQMMRQQQLDPDEAERILYKESGLLALSAESADMRDLLNSCSKSAKFAVDYYCYKINQFLGQALATLGSIDQIVFTAGIGENSALIRRRICQHLSWLGASLDDEKNDSNAVSIISDQSSKVILMKLQTDENHIIATETLACIGESQTTPGRQ